MIQSNYFIENSFLKIINDINYLLFSAVINGFYFSKNVLYVIGISGIYILIILAYISLFMLSVMVTIGAPIYLINYLYVKLISRKNLEKFNNFDKKKYTFNSQLTFDARE